MNRDAEMNSARLMRVYFSFFLYHYIMEPVEIYALFYEKNNDSKMNSTDEFIRTYESHKEKIESEENDFFERIRVEYATALGHNEEYIKALPLLTKNIEILTKPNNDNPLLVTESYLKSSRFLKAQSLYFTKDLHGAKAIFSKLNKEYPNNDIYKNWLKSSIHWKYQQTINILWGISAFSVVINSIFNWFKLKIWGEISISIIIICLLLIPTLIVISKQKQKNVVKTNN